MLSSGDSTLRWEPTGIQRHIVTPGKPQPSHRRRGPAALRAISIGKMFYLPSHPTLINCFN